MANLGSNTLVFPILNALSNPVTASISSLLNSKVELLTFSTIRSGLIVLGMTIMFRWVHHRRRTWPGVALCFSAILVITGWVRRDSTCVAEGTPSSSQLMSDGDISGCYVFLGIRTYLAGPKVENAITLIPYASQRSIKSCCTCVTKAVRQLC